MRSLHTAATPHCRLPAAHSESTRFIIELQHSKRESQFVPTPTIQQVIDRP
jgi:hypothetical protein